MRPTITAAAPAMQPSPRGPRLRCAPDGRFAPAPSSRTRATSRGPGGRHRCASSPPEGRPHHAAPPDKAAPAPRTPIPSGRIPGRPARPHCPRTATAPASVPGGGQPAARHGCDAISRSNSPPSMPDNEQPNRPKASGRAAGARNGGTAATSPLPPCREGSRTAPEASLRASNSPPCARPPGGAAPQSGMQAAGSSRTHRTTRGASLPPPASPAPALWRQHGDGPGQRASSRAVTKPVRLPFPAAPGRARRSGCRRLDGCGGSPPQAACGVGGPGLRAARSGRCGRRHPPGRCRDPPGSPSRRCSGPAPRSGLQAAGQPGRQPSSSDVRGRFRATGGAVGKVRGSGILPRGRGRTAMRPLRRCGARAKGKAGRRQPAGR